MENNIIKRNAKRAKRVLRTRKHTRGAADKPRLVVYKTNKHLSVQLIDDENKITLASAGTGSKDFRESSFNKKSKEAAKQIGMKIAELAKKMQIQKIVFDRGRYKYHGIIAELANAAREAGLQF
ncbi:MAG TPA: 50S ribosomal protein L18 [Rhabdochlamydiaceae bacterium]|nr:50S ribosomal protein L18 [Rhabdochlamydiaceae bacterium]